MKKSILVIFAVAVLFSMAACSKTGQVQPQEPAQTNPDTDWNLPETIEMTDEVNALFTNAMNGLTGVSYEPVGYMGEKDGVYCILCRATVVAPDAKPYYTLVYVTDKGVQNIWDIWMGAHAEK